MNTPAPGCSGMGMKQSSPGSATQNAGPQLGLIREASKHRSMTGPVQLSQSRPRQRSSAMSTNFGPNPTTEGAGESRRCRNYSTGYSVRTSRLSPCEIFVFSVPVLFVIDRPRSNTSKPWYGTVGWFPSGRIGMIDRCGDCLRQEKPYQAANRAADCSD